jgi:periplasmic divalent cation tolerance protein
MAAATRRTPENVKSSAMTPRQPEVPKWMAGAVTGSYCSLTSHVEKQRIWARNPRKSKGKMTDKIVVLVTCSSTGEATKIARAVVAKRLAACANIFSGRVESIYRWKGDVEKAREVLMLIKSSRMRFSALEQEIRRLHSYEVPEIIALSIERGSRGYLEWIAESVRPS